MLQHRISEHGIDASARGDSVSPFSNANSINSSQQDSNNNFNSIANHQQQQQIATNLLNQLLPNNMQLPFLMSGNPFGDLDVSKLTLPNGQQMPNGNVANVFFLLLFKKK